MTKTIPVGIVEWLALILFLFFGTLCITVLLRAAVAWGSKQHIAWARAFGLSIMVCMIQAGIVSVTAILSTGIAQSPDIQGATWLVNVGLSLLASAAYLGWKLGMGFAIGLKIAGILYAMWVGILIGCVLVLGAVLSF